MPAVVLSILCAINGIIKYMCLNTRQEIDTAMAGMAVTAMEDAKNREIMGKAKVMAKTKVEITAETKKLRSKELTRPSAFSKKRHNIIWLLKLTKQLPDVS